MTEFRKRGIESCSVSRESTLGQDKVFDGSFILPERSNPCCQEDIDFLVQLCTEKKINILINNSHADAMLELCSLVKLRLSQIQLISCVHGNPAGVLSSTCDELARISFSAAGLERIKQYLCFWLHYPYRCYSRKKWLRLKYRRLYGKSDAVVLLTPRTISVFQEISGIRSREKLHVIPNIVPAPNTPDVLPKEPLILWIGRMEYSAKRPDRMIRIWEKICDQTNWRLKMIGEGPARKDLEAYCAGHKITNVDFCGKQDPETFYRKAQVLCMTSSTESFGLVLVEAMGYGVVPVAFDSFPAARDIIENGENGLLVEKDSICDYARTLLHLTQTPNLCDKISHKVRLSAPQYSTETVIPQWLRLFDILGVSK